MAHYNNKMSLSLNHLQFFDNRSNSADHFIEGEDLANMDWSMRNVDPSLEKFSFQNSPLSQPTMSFQVQQVLQQNSHDLQQHPRIQNPTMQRFVEESQRQFFTAPMLPQEFLHGGSPHTSAPTSSLPRPSHQRIPSPPLSHGLTSISESVESPQADQDYYPENRYVLTDNQYQTQPFLDFQSGPTYQAYSLPQYHGSPCVSMNQIQTFADAEEVYYDNHDEGFEEAAIKSEYAMDFDQHTSRVNMNTAGETQSYRYPSDEGIGYSDQDERSPKHTIVVEEIRNTEEDADGEMDDMDYEHMPATPASDEEYSPRSTRPRKRRVSPAKTTAPSAKRGKISKASPKSRGQVICKLCDHTPFKDAGALQRHITTAHTRAYVCVFDFAGCPSTFASKNEWKRHVDTQHMNLKAWVCEQGACGSSHTKSAHSFSNMKGDAPQGIEFNRKDLFTQHLRRMHVPSHVKRKKASQDTAWEETIKNLQETCLYTKREAPTRLNCPVHGCKVHFDGAGCLNDRMEHVGKHLEEQAQGKLVLRQGDDDLLVDWACNEGIVEQKAGGGFRLVVGSGGNGRRAVKAERRGVEADGEEDAEGEDDE
ncbi:hypothetical protein VTL71DRAFT_12990 [Oculimacula yallundae]|uniref:C2H2-type domain-containing protein n=1 Tax=Oculimacula yallundae TaxID=86028 RepID=A0ABR4CPJ0_9HELO